MPPASKAASRITNKPTRLPGVDNRSSRGRRRRDLINGFMNSLGGADKISTAVMADIVRAAELSLICEQERARTFQGHDVDLGNLTRLESTRDRAVRRLNIKPRKAGAPWSPLLERFGNSSDKAAE